MKKPIQASLHYPVVTLLLTFVVVAIGIHALLKMPRMEDPNITVRTGLVIAMYPGATTEQVEKQVTRTLEDHIYKFSEIRKEKTFSTSRPGLCIINVELEDRVTNADTFWAKLRNEMIEVRASSLPQEVVGPVVNSDFGDTVAMLIAVHGPRYGYRELRDYVDRIQDELRTIRDVGKLATYGEQQEQIWVTSSLERMSQYSADPSRMIQALQQRNIIKDSGNLDADQAKIPFRTTGSFSNLDQVRNLIVNVSSTGQPIYIRDFADVERRYEDPTFLTRFDGEPSVMLSVEMQRGKNIVDLGEKISDSLARLRPLLPPDLKMDLVANQPSVVHERMFGMGREFLLAIVSVIIVTIILLPLRVAVIAAVAIPVTISTTVGMMNVLGMELHQVSIAALIVVLGIVVDDAIVIADNYVELLDHGVPRSEAAWRSASEMFVPVLTATLTIIASFLPLLIISGTAGEFTKALPITVAIALSVSFIVAIFLTPVLCRFFIKQGLHAPQIENGKRKKSSILDKLQLIYNKAIVFLMKRKILALALGVVAFSVGVMLFRVVPQQFFPSAERDQCVIDVWMPQGTRIEGTDGVMRRIEQHLRSQSEIAHYSSFVGQSAPRFYYNVNPQQADGAYGQFIVQAKSAELTPALVTRLRTDLSRIAPEALTIVKELQQGSQQEAPVEIRISGDDPAKLKALGRQVEDILRGVSYSQFVHNDYYNDSYMVDVKVNEELANRLGLTNANVAQTLTGAFVGTSVSTYWEGNRAVNIMLRLDPSHRSTFEDLQETYIPSQESHSSVPLHSFATLNPEWQTSRLVRRNGVPTLTVRAFVKRGHYASTLVNDTANSIKNIPLPPGYRITYGGEVFNQNETFPQMISALGISLAAIFLVLLVQFRTFTDPLVVMASIPLALFGAAVGLLVTGNAFSFTAFMGMISLCGIVVRNGIILIDYIHEKLREGLSLEQAATEAGERRLRPIFLTTMAAAVGVTPMILSGSSLWSPLASVIAMGLIFSMFFTLLVVPVLFVVVQSKTRKVPPQAIVALIVAAILIAAPSGIMAQQNEHKAEPNLASFETDHANPEMVLTLQHAVELAIQQNREIHIMRAKATESGHRLAAAKADLYPQVSNSTNAIAVANKNVIDISKGALGTVSGNPFPQQNTSISQGSDVLFLSNTTVSQPLTQLFKIHAGVQQANSDVRASKEDIRKTENGIALDVHRLFFNLLIETQQRIALCASADAAAQKLKENEDAIRDGTALDISAISSRADLLRLKEELLAADNQIADSNAELNDILGLPLNTHLQLESVDESIPDSKAQNDFVQMALSVNPEIQSAKEQVVKARAGLDSAKYDFIPEVSAFVQHTYQDGAPFVTHNNETYGGQMSWKIFDAGKKRSVVGQRKAQIEQAEQNLQRLQSRVSVDVEKAYRNVERSRLMIQVSQEVLTLRRENERIHKNQASAGIIQQSQYKEAIAERARAEAEELQARLSYELAVADLHHAVGLMP